VEEHIALGVCAGQRSGPVAGTVEERYARTTDGSRGGIDNMYLDVTDGVRGEEEAGK
jgi:hypothetical protein